MLWYILEERGAKRWALITSLTSLLAGGPDGRGSSEPSKQGRAKLKGNQGNHPFLFSFFFFSLAVAVEASRTYEKQGRNPVPRLLMLGGYFLKAAEII